MSDNYCKDILDDICRALPLDTFVTEDPDGGAAVIDMSTIDAADYKDNCDAFNRAMILAYEYRKEMDSL